MELLPVARWFMLGTVVTQVDIFSSIESLDYGMPYPLLIYLYLLRLIRQESTSFYGHIFYLTLDVTTLVLTIFMPMQQMFQHSRPPLM